MQLTLPLHWKSRSLLRQCIINMLLTHYYGSSSYLCSVMIVLISWDKRCKSQMCSEWMKHFSGWDFTAKVDDRKPSAAIWRKLSFSFVSPPFQLSRGNKKATKRYVAAAVKARSSGEHGRKPFCSRLSQICTCVESTLHGADSEWQLCHSFLSISIRVTWEDNLDS